MGLRGVAISAALVVGVLLAVDRFGVRYAEDRVAAQLQEELELTTTPEVDITGFPVLDQALAGRYDDVRLRLDAADLGDLTDLDVTIRLRGLQITLAELQSEEVEPIPVRQVDGEVLVPFDTVAEQIGEGVTVTRSSEGVVVTDTIDVLGQDIEISGTGQLSVVGPSELGVTVVGLNLAGIDIPDSLVDQLQEQLSFTYELPPLPFGLGIVEATTTDDGFEVTAEATDAVIDPEAIPTG